MELRKMFLLLLCCIFLATTVAVDSSWRPVVPAQLSSSILHQESTGIYDGTGHSAFNIDETPLSEQLLLQPDQDTCALYKVAMNQQLYFEYVRYKLKMPDLKEFTLCMWTKFTNHTNDHPLFSYAVDDQPRGILSWIANTQRSSYYMMNIDGHNLYRLNYPLRLNKWYHSCQSWNGRTGEWQIWVNDERVGRGFNNRLVGHVIKGGGIAISGQEQRQLGGGFLEGEGAPQGSGGLLGEFTMVQLYNVALTAGKAHKDHKHHHAHHYEHDTSNNTPRPTTSPPVTGPSLPMHPYLTAGQINHQVKLNPGTNYQINHNGVTLRHPSVAQPPVPMPYPPINLDTQQTIPQVTPSYKSIFDSNQFFGKPYQNLFRFPTPEVPIDDYRYSESQYHNLFKRERKINKRIDVDVDDDDDDDVDKVEDGALTANIEQFESKKEVFKRDIGDDKVSFVKSEKSSDEKLVVKRDSDKKKRELVQLSDGSIINDDYLVPQSLKNDFFAGLASFGEQTNKKQERDEREPAEAEVRMVMNVCDGCTPDPFEKALIMDWRSVPKKIYSGALWLPAAQACKAF